MRPSRETDVENDAPRKRAVDIDDDPDDEDDAAPAPARTPVREGLPPTYRMRHEPHYVETLAAPPSAAVQQPAPRPVPPAVEPSVAVREAVAAPRFGELAASLAEALTAIQESLSHVPMRSRPLGERVAIDLARAEAVRASWLAESALVLQSDPLPSLDEVDLGSVFRTVSNALAPEHRLAGGAPTVTMPLERCSVFGDERLLTTALGSLLAALRRLIEERGDPSRVEVSIAPRVDTASRTVEVTQSAVRLPASALARFFDAEWSEHPAGAVGALLLAASRRIADAHGGSLEIAEIDGGGCRLALSLPAAG